MTTFKELGLKPELMKGLDDLGFVEPSPIQGEAIPFLLKSQQDLIALAQTGTGKTAAFSLPILNQIDENERNLVSIILCPTRELCMQISQDVKKYAKYSKEIKVTPVYGGEKIDIQIRALKRNPHIVVGTPGRVCDLIRRKILKLHNVKWVVLDEADEMLDMGFKEDLDNILKETPDTKQTLLFSATISKSVHNIAKKYMKDTKEISIGEKNKGADNVSHEYYIVQNRSRFEALQRILDSVPGIYGILFCRTRNSTQEVADKLKRAGYNTDALHGDISQAMRTKIMDRFKRKQIKLLVATDVAARGIDVNDLSHVINYNLPDQMESYTHRSGRTGRAQKSGISVSILTPNDTRKVRELERIIGKKFEHKQIPTGEDICKKQISNFVEEIETAETKESPDAEYLQEFVDRLKKMKKDDLIKHFINNKFSYLMNSYKDTRDLNSHASAPDSSGSRGRKNDKKRERSMSTDTIDLKINFGKQHGFDIKELFSLINSNRKLKGIEVGRISLMPEYSTFSVERGQENDVINCLTGTNFKGEKINIRKSNTSGKRSSYSSRGSKPYSGGDKSFSDKKRSGGSRDRRSGSRDSGSRDRRSGSRDNKRFSSKRRPQRSN